MEEFIEEKLEEYKNLEVERISKQSKLDANEKIEEIKEHIKEMKAEQVRLELELREETQPFTEKIAEIETKQAEVKSEIASNWTIEEKTYKGSIADVTKRTTKFITIVDKAKLAHFLLLNNKAEEGISKFDLKLLRKFKDAKILDDDAVTLEEKHSISIKFKES